MAAGYGPADAAAEAAAGEGASGGLSLTAHALLALAAALGVSRPELFPLGPVSAALGAWQGVGGGGGGVVLEGGGGCTWYWERAARVRCSGHVRLGGRAARVRCEVGAIGDVAGLGAGGSTGSPAPPQGVHPLVPGLHVSGYGWPAAPSPAPPVPSPLPVLRYFGLVWFRFGLVCTNLQCPRPPAPRPPQPRS